MLYFPDYLLWFGFRACGLACRIAGALIVSINKLDGSRSLGVIWGRLHYCTGIQRNPNLDKYPAGNATSRDYRQNW